MHAGLFLELSLGSGHWVFTIGASGRDLPIGLTRRVAYLLDEHDLVVVIDRHDERSRRALDPAIDLGLSKRVDDTVLVDGNIFGLIDDLGTEALPVAHSRSL